MYELEQVRSELKGKEQKKHSQELLKSMNEKKIAHANSLTQTQIKVNTVLGLMLFYEQ